MLGHELAHVARGDLWIEAAWAALNLAYWFHPVAYLARRLGYEEDFPRLRSDLNRHVQNVLELSGKLLG